MKKVLTFLLAMAMCVSTFAACGSNGTTSSTASKADTTSTAEVDDTSAGDTNTPEATTNEVTYPIAESTTISWWHPLRAPSYQSSHDDNIVWQQIAENVGVEIEWIHPASGTETEQLNMLIVSGDLPDIIQIDGLIENSGGSAGGVEDGIFVDLTDYVAELAPDYVRAITASDLAYAMATTADGKITEFDQIKQTAPQYSRVNVRNDIMEESGWGDRLPETIDDYTEMFADMQAAGYYGYRLASSGLNGQMMYPYGIYPGFFIEEDGNVAYGMWHEGFRQYLTQIKEWLDAGYIHPDWTSDIGSDALIANKEIGMYITPSDIAYGLAKANGYEITCVNYPRLNSGDEMRFETTTWDAVSADGIRTVVTQDCMDAGRFEAAMALLNYGYTEEGALLYNWGVEGETYTVDADGNKTFTDNLLNNEDGIPMSDAQYIYKLHFGPKLAEPDVSCNPGTIGDEKALYWRELYSDDTTVNSDGVIFASLTVDQSVARGDIMTDVETYMYESTLHFLLGEKDITDDAQWQDYMDTMQSLGIEDAIAITQEAVDNFNSKSIPTDWVSHN